PDNDLAELLFILYAWRCPWTDDPGETAWRYAMVELLHNELIGNLTTPETRAQAWNAAITDGNSSAYKEPFDRAHPPWRFELLGGNGMPYVLNYFGVADTQQILKRRLLLPLYSIINARTLLLDVPGRSGLDAEFVLA